MLFKFLKKEYPSIDKDGLLSLNDIYDVWKVDNQDGPFKYKIFFLQKYHQNSLVASFSSFEDRNKAFDNIMNELEKTHNKNTDNKFNIMDHIKGFIEENKQTIYWIAIILLVDQIFLDGSLRTKTKDLFDSLINRLNKKINE